LKNAIEPTLREHRRARQLPGEAFGSMRFFELDRAIFLGAWLPVCHVSELREPGAFTALEAFGERVIVVRGADLELRAFFDRCLHRGTPLTTDAFGRLERLELVCPYHGLRYDLRGGAREPEATTLCLERRSLDRAAVAERFGFVFVRPRGEARSIADEPAPPWLERASLHTLKLLLRRVHVARANWKLLAQNFQESHHFALVHPSLERRTPYAASESHDFGGRFLGGTMRLAGDCETVSESRLRNGRPFIAAEEDRRVVRDACLFPGWLTSLQPDYLLSYRLLPRLPDETRVVFEIYVHAEADTSAADDLSTFWDRTNAEDRAVCERQQRGVTSPSYRPGPYAPSEDGMHAFDRLVAGQYSTLSEGR
jgi:glycine betaine catabolism A